MVDKIKSNPKAIIVIVSVALFVSFFIYRNAFINGLLEEYLRHPPNIIIVGDRFHNARAGMTISEVKKEYRYPIRISTGLFGIEKWYYIIENHYVPHDASDINNGDRSIYILGTFKFKDGRLVSNPKATSIP